MECYVEFLNEQEAEDTVKRVNRGADIGQGPRMGVRRIDVELSTQEDFLKAMFPLTKCIRWEDGRPIRVPNREDENWSTGFKGFLTEEEMFCNLRHAEMPHRVCWTL